MIGKLIYLILGVLIGMGIVSLLSTNSQEDVAKEWEVYDFGYRIGYEMGYKDGLESDEVDKFNYTMR